MEKIVGGKTPEVEIPEITIPIYEHKVGEYKPNLFNKIIDFIFRRKRKTIKNFEQYTVTVGEKKPLKIAISKQSDKELAEQLIADLNK